MRGGDQRECSGEQVEVMRPRLHGVDEQLVSAIEPEDDQFEEPARRIEPQPEFPRWTVLVENRDVDRTLRGIDAVSASDAVPQAAACTSTATPR